MALRYFKVGMASLLAMLVFGVSVGTGAAVAAEERPAVLNDVGLDPVLGRELPLNEEFLDESGKPVRLGSFFTGKQPVALVLSYYGCPMLCGLLLNSARGSFERIDWKPGEHYKIVTISIDPQEGPALAKAKKASIVGASTQAVFRAAATTDWHFLVGKNGSEKRLAENLGFRYKWVESEKQWAHGAALFVLSPAGKLSRVLFGLDFPPRDLKFALLEAGEGKIGTIAEKLLLFCYHYDPRDNKYALLATRLVSLGGALTVIALLLAYLVWFLRNRKKGNSCSLSV